MEFGTN